MGFSIGDGNNINFWSDDWTMSMLKHRFPRIFALATKKVGKFKEFGSWIDDKWVWCIVLRRNIFYWEQDYWIAFNSLFADFSLCKKFKDHCSRWKGSSSGVYSSKSFCHLVLSKTRPLCAPWKLIWIGLIPHKIEIFCWKLLKGRVAVRELLAR
ncbi:hypothetical protein REPUB_Repub11eG0014500 [Reevesia pubescens]